MYNFMEKTHEDNKLQRELELTFRKEESEEDERRHKKLIDAILGRKPKKQPEKEEDKSWVEKIMDGLKSLLSPVFLALKGIQNYLSELSKSLVENITKIVKGIFGSIFTPMGFKQLFWPLLRRFLWPLILFEIADQFEDIRSKKSKAREASDITKTLSQAPMDTKDMDLSNHLTPEGLEDYNKGKYKLYSIPVIDTGGKRNDFPLTEEETNKLKTAYAVVAQGYDKLYKIENSEMQPPSDEEIENIKTSIVKNKLIIAEIQKNSLSRQKIYKKGFGYDTEDVGNDINKALKKYGRTNATEEIDKSFFQNKIDSAIDAVIPDIKLPEFKKDVLLQRGENTEVYSTPKQLPTPSAEIPTPKQIPAPIDVEKTLGEGEEIVKDSVVISSTNNIGGKSEVIDTTPISPRILNDSINWATSRNFARV